MAYSIILLENLTELKIRRGNATSTTIASVLGLDFPTTEAFAFYRWDDTSTAIGDDNEIVHPTTGSWLPGRWFKNDLGITAQLIFAALGYIPYDEDNPDGFISGYTETDPNVPAFAKSLTSFAIIKALTDPLYQPVGSYLTSETDPTVPSYSKSLTAFSIIKSSTDPLYYPLSSNPSGYLTSVPAQSFASLTGKPTTLSGYGITDAYPLSGNPSSFITQAGARTAISLTTTGTGAASYNNSTGVINIPTPIITNYTAGTGISISSGIITNTAPDQIVSLTAGSNISITGTYPNFTIGELKRKETSSGTTNASGVYTFTFANTYSVPPNVQANIINATDSQIIKIGTPTTTSVTVTVRNRVDVIGLLPTWTNVNGANVDILVTEK